MLRTFETNVKEQMGVMDCKDFLINPQMSLLSLHLHLYNYFIACVLSHCGDKLKDGFYFKMFQIQ